MPMHLPAVRKGLIPQREVPAPYGGVYGALALRPNPGHYDGVRWAYVKYKRTECKGYDDAVKEYEKHKYAKHLLKMDCTNVFDIFLGQEVSKRCYATADEMQAAETEGQGRLGRPAKPIPKGEAQGDVQIDTSGGYTITEDAGMIDPLTGLPYDSAAVDYSSGEESEESSNAGLYLAVGALLLATGGVIIYKRKKKGKKGGKGKKKGGRGR